MTTPLVDTVASVEAKLRLEEAIYETARKALLTNWQAWRKHLRHFLVVLQDEAAETEEEDDG